jgi:hypothetical protein
MRSKRVRRLETNDMRYLSRIPKNIPPGRVIAHNNILHGPNWPTGPHGFRAWTWTASKEHADFVLCPCGWSGLEHYAHKDAVDYFREGTANGWVINTDFRGRWILHLRAFE